jgi:intracellular sulfur oxidation DsrE/DsrF family protein
MRRIVSVVSTGPSLVSPVDTVLEPNAYAVAEDVDLTVVLRGPGVQHAVEAADTSGTAVAGVALPSSTDRADLRGLLESGITVLVDADDLTAAGLAAGDLVTGVRVVDGGGIAGVLRAADGVLSW